MLSLGSFRVTRAQSLDCEGFYDDDNEGERRTDVMRNGIKERKECISALLRETVRRSVRGSLSREDNGKRVIQFKTEKGGKLYKLDENLFG